MGKLITLTAADGHTLDAYRADPQGKARGGLVVAQEIFGVNHHIRAVCDGFAEAGYLAVAPALFDRSRKKVEFGYTPDDIAKGREIMQTLDLNNAMKDMAAAAAVVKAAGKVGVVGYCWGGTVAWASATRLDGIAASVCYYGGGIGGLAAEKPRCPVMLHFGDQDQSIPMEVVEKVRAAHPALPLYVYHAGHGFNCDARGSYHAESAKLALDRTLGFLREHVG
ncbi:MAG TPA: dienelactone hydrolase family protein [Stellaceae bacterium]|nr:dienelactone hydrolase family protein [Stellaceae bacterium]